MSPAASKLLVGLYWTVQEYLLFILNISHQFGFRTLLTPAFSNPVFFSIFSPLPLLAVEGACRVCLEVVESNQDLSHVLRGNRKSVSPREPLTGAVVYLLPRKHRTDLQRIRAWHPYEREALIHYKRACRVAAETVGLSIKTE